VDCDAENKRKPGTTTHDGAKNHKKTIGMEGREVEVRGNKGSQKRCSKSVEDSNPCAKCSKGKTEDNYDSATRSGS